MSTTSDTRVVKRGTCNTPFSATVSGGPFECVACTARTVDFVACPSSTDAAHGPSVRACVRVKKLMNYSIASWRRPPAPSPAHSSAHQLAHARAWCSAVFYTHDVWVGAGDDADAQVQLPREVGVIKVPLAPHRVACTHFNRKARHLR